MRVRVACVILALVSTGGCTPRRPMVAPLPACAPAPASTAGWETKDEDLFTFQIPRGLRYGLVRGIDSTPETWTGRGLHIHHEAGPYAGRSLGAGENTRNYVECTTMIGGVEAHVASWNTPRGGFMLHASWRRIAPAGSFGDTNLAITISTRSSDPQSQAIAHAVIHSVRFPDRPATAAGLLSFHPEPMDDRFLPPFRPAAPDRADRVRRERQGPARHGPGGGGARVHGKLRAGSARRGT